ncbi:FMN-binding domain protein [Rubripirellula lacrimiformis]|uniref:FMN-binding domain protein n=1 Tax=Rubripirellula lacrimiformis TaxID=1930273 RepID=A0A517NAJ3_9BACT|nr:FMN-binding protein [Rubripirellula lacrimiformis]QDT04038.1 FMN-binding domain protein [Rubripirellula lacrimiformis]
MPAFDSRIGFAFLLVITTMWGSASSGTAQDRVEFLSGAKLQGKILQIRKDAKEFDIETMLGGRKFTRTYPYSKVHAVTIGDKRFELTPMSPTGTANSSQSEPDADSPPVRSQKQVQQLIDQAGQTLPDWFESTQLDYPNTLDLSWPLKATGPWNGRKNVGQHLWDTISPNRRRWHSGIKLIHHCLSLHSDPALQQRDKEKLGNLYFTLLQDYPRAAYWYQQANTTVAKPDGIHLAECYWRMGNSKMALDLLDSRLMSMDAVKLLGDMGHLDQAIRAAQPYLGSAMDNQTLLALGDAARTNQKTDAAIAYYQNVLSNDNFRNQEYKDRLQARARQSIDAIRLRDAADPAKVPDGTFTDRSTGYNGNVEVEVKVASGQIQSVNVTKHREKQFYAALDDVPRQIIRRQSIEGIDGTSGATITAEAIVHATAKALAGASR